MTRKGRAPVDELDAILASNRQRMILLMRNSGKLDPESAAFLYENTTRPDIVTRDRKALDNKGEFDPDSPSGVLSTLYFKLRSTK